MNARHRVTKVVLDVSLHWLYAHPDNVNLFVGYLSMALHMRSRGGCKIQIVGCKDRKGQEGFESYVPEKQLCRTERDEFLVYLKAAKELEKTLSGDTFFDTLFET